MGGNNRPQEHKMITPITLDLIKKNSFQTVLLFCD